MSMRQPLTWPWNPSISPVSVRNPLWIYQSCCVDRSSGIKQKGHIDERENDADCDFVKQTLFSLCISTCRSNSCFLHEWLWCIEPVLFTTPILVA